MNRNIAGNNQKSICYSTTSRPSSRCTPCFFEPSDREDWKIYDNAIVDKDHLASICMHLCYQLRIIINMLVDFATDVCDESTNARSLLRELEDKVFPFLVNTDIEMAKSEALIRINIDTAKIGETKVDWLLKFNKCKLEMREILTTLSDAVYEELKRVLSLRCRGCYGVNVNQELLHSLRQMKNSTDKLQKQIQLEQMAFSY